MAAGRSACGALWPAPPCGWHGQCDEAAGACVCEEGWKPSPLVVDGVALCNNPDGLLPAALASCAAVLVCSTVAEAARIAVDWRAGRLRDRRDRADNALALGFAFATAIGMTISAMDGLPFQTDPAAAAWVWLGSVLLARRQYARNERMARASLDELGVRSRNADLTANSKLFKVVMALAVVAGFASHVCFLAGAIAADINMRVFALSQVSLSLVSMLGTQR
jgi:hypothetical protein